MTCPGCGLLEARVVRTIAAPAVDRRQRKCRCGVFWNTSERIDKGSVRGLTDVKGEIGNAQPGHAIKRAGKTLGERDIPGLDPSSGLNTDFNPKASMPSEARARVGRKGRPSTNEYTPEFERLWGSLSVKRGNKLPAFQALVKVKPGISHELIFTRYEQWAATPQWQDGFAPYVATWLNQRGWENQPGPADFKRRGNGITPATKGWSGPSETFAGGDVKL